jgi:uncharacterized protein YjcR
VPRPRDPRRDEAKSIWLNSKGDLKLVELAEQMNVTPSTIRKWKAQDKWDNELKGSALKSKRSAPKLSRGHPGGQPGNQNAAGHGAPTGNQNATKFGFFSKYLPAESVEIMQQIDTSNPADLLWDQIMIQYTAIIRAQKIMLVQDHDDTTKVTNMYMHSSSKKETKTTTTESSTDQEGYLIQFAWDKQANFLNAQSRAMGELRALIKQFVAIADEQDERRKRIALMEAQIGKINYSMRDEDNAEDKVGDLLDKLEGAFKDGES